MKGLFAEAERSGAGGRAGRREFRGGPVGQAAVRSELVVLGSPSVREVPRFGQAREHLDVEQLVPVRRPQDVGPARTGNGG